MLAKNQKCLYCERDSALVPLIAVQYREQEFWICPQHLPLLIHKPEQLVGFLPGADGLDAADE